MSCYPEMGMIEARRNREDKWWPPDLPRRFMDPVTGGLLEQILMEFYNEPGMWRCSAWGWNEVFSSYSAPRCRKCGHSMRLQERLR